MTLTKNYSDAESSQGQDCPKKTTESQELILQISKTLKEIEEKISPVLVEKDKEAPTSKAPTETSEILFLLDDVLLKAQRIKDSIRL